MIMYWNVSYFIFLDIILLPYPAQKWARGFCLMIPIQDFQPFV